MCNISWICLFSYQLKAIELPVAQCIDLKFTSQPRIISSLILSNSANRLKHLTRSHYVMQLEITFPRLNVPHILPWKSVKTCSLVNLINVKFVFILLMSLPVICFLTQVVQTIEDHHQEVIALFRENGFHGLVAYDSDYALCNIPCYFSAHALKLSRNGKSITTSQYLMHEVAKQLNLNPNRFVIFASLLGRFVGLPRT